MEDTLQKTISRRNSLVTKSCSLERSISQTDVQQRIFIDLDTDLIHHKSYSEFEDSGDEEVDLEVVSTPPSPAVAVSENLPLLRQRFPMYNTAKVSSERDAGVVNAGCEVAGSQSEAVTDTTRGCNPVHEPELKGGYKSSDEGRQADADGTASSPEHMTDGRFIREY